jgi:hypothetical protein
LNERKNKLEERYRTMTSWGTAILIEASGKRRRRLSAAGGSSELASVTIAKEVIKIDPPPATLKEPSQKPQLATQTE